MAEEIATRQVLTIAHIHLGCTATGHVSVQIQGSALLDDEPAIKERWDRACKAFVDEFAGDIDLLAMRGGSNTALREHMMPKAEQDGAKVY